jgi:membrane protein YqaA with SNARE-associated domain
VIGQATAWIMALLKTHGAAAVFVGVIVESVIVPIPSPLIIMGAGAILIDPGLGLGAALPHILAKIVLPGAVASTLGAYIAYGIAYWGGKPVIDRFSGFLGFTWDEILGMEKRLEGRVGAMLFLLRAAPIVPLSLISAAAGFGKTTLVSEWIAGCGRPVAWLSLDEGDSDLTRFLTYLVAAVQTIAPHIGAATLSVLQSSQPPSTDVLQTALLGPVELWQVLLSHWQPTCVHIC